MALRKVRQRVFPKSVLKKPQKTAVSKQPPTAEVEVDWQTQQADQTGDDATGFEGGNVGEEENLPAAEQEAESQNAEVAAPEEAEAEAQPEDGEQVELDEATQTEDAGQ